jgi:hypothetical protein
MRERFEQLVAGGAPAVRALIGEQEELDFDCKLKTHASTGLPEKRDKEILGKILSAFSNSVGGLLLWGVDARPNNAGIDCVHAFSPISDIALFENDAAYLRRSG